MPHPQSKRARDAKAKRAQERSHTTEEQRRGTNAKRAAAAELRRQFQRDRLRRRRMRRFRSGLGALLAVAVAGLGLWWVLRPPPELEGVERLQNLGRDHIAGATFADSTPTSGPHLASSPTCGVYPEPLPLDLAVHALEHGTVVLWYQADQPSLGADLVSATSAWDSHVIISPSDALDSPIVATAWTRRKSYTQADDDLTKFVDTYRERGPESVECDR